MSTPVRIQRKRTKGWKMPANTVAVTRPSKNGNPFKVGIHGTLEECLEKFIRWSSMRSGAIKELSGKNLACFCKTDNNSLCHADILLILANPNVKFAFYDKYKSLFNLQEKKETR